MNKIEKSLREMWGTIKCMVVHIMRIPEEGRKKGEKSIQENNGRKLLKFIEKH